MRKGSVWQLDGLECTPTQNVEEKKWLAMRREGIGGSDIAAIMGRSPWQSALGVYAQKTGLAPDKEATEAMEFGTMMEPTLRKWAEARITDPDGEPLQVLSSPYLYKNPQHPIFIANLDGVAIRGEEVYAGLELKTVDRFYAKEWDDNAVPVQYRDQVQWYMGVTGIPHWFVGALIGKRFEIRLLHLDLEYVRNLQQAALGFWENYVIPRVMPPATAEDRQILVSLFPEAGEEIIEDEDFESIIEDFITARDREKEYANVKETLQAQISQRIGEAAGMKAGVFKATWSRYDTTRVDSKKLQNEYPDVYAAVAKSSRTSRLNVKKED